MRISGNIATLPLEAFWNYLDSDDDCSHALQAAIDYGYSTKSGLGFAVEFQDGKTYKVSGILLKPGVSLVTSGAVAATFTEDASYTNGARIKQVENKDEPMIANDTSIGLIRAISNVDGLPQRYINISIRGITFIGASVAGSTPNCDLLHLTHVWNVDIDRCQFNNATGLGLASLDNNEVRINLCSGIYAPIMLDDAADCKVIDSDFGGGNGVYRSPVWLSGVGCWKNKMSMFGFNNQDMRGGTTAPVAALATVDAAANTFTFVDDQIWTTGLPLVLSPETTTAPTGVTVTDTYYAIRVSAKVFKLATNRVNALANTPIDITTAGANVYVACGHDAGIVLNAGANTNIFTDIRSDQNYTDGVLCVGAPGNSFDGVDVCENGWSAAGPAGAGFNLTQGSVNTSFGVGNINGRKLAGTKSSKQKYGILCDASSITGLSISEGLVVINHTVTNSEAGALGYSPRYINPNKIVFDVSSFGLIQGTPAVGIVGGGRGLAWLFDAAADESIAGTFVLPQQYSTVDIELVWSNNGAGAGDVQWSLNLGAFDAGQTMNAADPYAPTLTPSTAGLVDVVISAIFENAAIPLMINKTFSRIRVKRTGTSVNDTLANDAALEAVVFYKAQG